MKQETRIGTAGWNIPQQSRNDFAHQGSQLERYASRFSAVEINSSFYRSHKRSTYQRWALAVPADFRFAVKLPKEITHKRKLVDCTQPLDQFFEESGGLGGKLGPILVQLPPSLAFDAAVATIFLEAIRSRFGGQIACEPRHPSWFDDQADGLSVQWRIARVVADPSPVPRALSPGGWPDFAYFRLHGSPKLYYSPYSEPQLDTWVRAMTSTKAQANWCIFDNTASGEASGNALALMARL